METEAQPACQKESFLGRNKGNGRLRYLARCAASTQKAALSEVPAAEWKRKAVITHGKVGRARRCERSLQLLPV